jgi:hypothetical protein
MLMGQDLQIGEDETQGTRTTGRNLYSHLCPSREECYPGMAGLRWEAMSCLVPGSLTGLQQKGTHETDGDYTSYSYQEKHRRWCFQVLGWTVAGNDCRLLEPLNVSLQQMVKHHIPQAVREQGWRTCGLMLSLGVAPCRRPGQV